MSPPCRTRRAHFLGLRTALVIAAGLLPVLAACHRDMRDQPRYEVLEASTFFPSGQSARPVPQGTVPRGSLAEDESFVTGKNGEAFLEQIPLPLDESLLHRGQERFQIYCTPCHGRLGDGDGMIVRRGFRRPPSYHVQRLREAPAGHFVDVMTRGFGAMPAYGAQIAPRDRWAIVAYVRALQLSQNATVDDLPPDQREQLDGGAR